MKKACIIFPQQLFEMSPLPLKDSMIFLVEEQLFFRQYSFHKQKIGFMRAGMKFYESWLNERGISKLVYISSGDEGDDVSALFKIMKSKGIEELHFIDPVDNWL